MASSLDTLLAQLAKLQQGSPYDAGLATAMQNAQYQLSDLDRSYTTGRQGVESDYEGFVRDLGKARDTGVKNTMGAFADRGTLHSGIHAAEQGKVEEEYQGGLTNAAQRRLQGFNQLDESRRQGESGIQQMLVGAQQDYTRRQQEAAQAAAALQAQREAAAAQAAQNAAMQRQMIAAMNAQGGGGGGGIPAQQGPRTGSVDAGMMGSRYNVIAPEDFDKQFNIVRYVYGDDAARKWLTTNNRYGGLTQDQRAFMTPEQRRTSMVSRRNQ